MKIRRFIFIILLAVLLIGLNYIYAPGRFYYNEEDNTIDVLFLGTSMSYCTFNPVVIDEELGLETYNLGRQRQTIPMTYYQLVDALKTQTPETVVLECYGISFDVDYADELGGGVAASTLDLMKPSLQKAESIMANVEPQLWMEYFVPLVRWHSTPSKIIDIKNKKNKDLLRGYKKFEDAIVAERPDDDLINDTSFGTISDKNMEYLNKIKDLLEEEGINLIIVKAPLPLNEDLRKRTNTLEKWAEENGLTFVDYTKLYDELKLDFSKDFVDENHLNIYGSEKVSKYFSNWYLEEYGN